jgi:Mannosyltransferase (PIG-V)
MKAATSVLQVSARADDANVSAPDEAGQPGLLDRTAWRDAALVWAVQHVLLLAITYFGLTLVLTHGAGQKVLSWSGLFSPWLGWDGAHYAQIASGGYGRFYQTIFFPLLPILAHVVAPLTAGNTGIAAAVVSNVAALGAFGLLRVLVEREQGRETARRALLYLALFPTSFFLAAAYAESLLLLLSLGAFLALRRGHWLVAGALAALATLARPVGILLVVPIAVECVLRVRAAGALPRPRQALAVLAGLALPFVALGGLSLYYYRRFGTWNAFIRAQSNGGSGKSLTWPWVGVLRAGRALVQNGLNPNYFQVHILLDAAFTALLIALVVATIRRLALPYVAYALAILVLLICTPGHNWYALFSNMRFTLEVFPVFMVLGQWGERRQVERAIFVSFLPFLVLFTVTFLLHEWVA